MSTPPRLALQVHIFLPHLTYLHKVQWDLDSSLHVHKKHLIPELYSLASTPSLNRSYAVDQAGLDFPFLCLLSAVTIAFSYHTPYSL